MNLDYWRKKRKAIAFAGCTIWNVLHPENSCGAELWLPRLTASPSLVTGCCSFFVLLPSFFQCSQNDEL